MNEGISGKEKLEQLRIKAIQLYQNKWKISDICSNLKVSRNWFYKWQKRYETGCYNWYEEQSRSPKKQSKRTDRATEKLIIDTRKELVLKPYRQYGPQAIYYRLEQKGVRAPSIWTIARIIKRNNLTVNKRFTSYISKGKKYPYEYALCQEMDFVGPRYLYSKARFYFHNIICNDTHFAQATVCYNQTSDNICTSLIHFWKTAGVPDFLQMDNALSFWGSLNKPNAVGKVIRFCLLHNVVPVFIPIREPWRNGIIEHFNFTMQNAILKTEKFNDVVQLQEASNRFCEVHNNTHHYSTQKGMTPKQAMAFYHYPFVKLRDNYQIPSRRLTLEKGEIHIIRFIRSDLKFNLFGLSYKLPEIKGIIITNEHRLKIYNDQELITEFQFVLFP